MNYFKKALLLFALFTSFISYSQDSLSVLFIGNSYTYVNDLPTLFLNVTQSLGDNATIDSKSNGGYTFQNHLTDPLTHTKIGSQAWDYVVIQGQSQEPSFPYDQVNINTLPPAVQLADSVYANNYCSQVMYFMTWGRQVGDPQWDSINTFDKMNVRLRNAYLRISDSAEASVSPVGVAWKYVRDNYPTINLYSGDGSHPSMEGSYLAACTFYASLFRKSPVGATYTAGLSATVAGQLQEAAALSVLDSLSTWHLRPKSDITIANFTSTNSGYTVDFENESWRATSYSWNFGDGFNSTDENPSHTYATNGNYTVELIAESVCGNDTTSALINLPLLGLNENESNFELSHTGENQYVLTSDSQLSDVILVDLNGRNMKNFSQSTTELNLNLNDFPSGIYILSFKSNDKVYSRKLVRFF
jgi:PKD repeat protein